VDDGPKNTVDGAFPHGCEQLPVTDGDVMDDNISMKTPDNP
jgi:hypothetical protein